MMVQAARDKSKNDSDWQSCICQRYLIAARTRLIVSQRQRIASRLVADEARMTDMKADTFAPANGPGGVDIYVL